MAARNKVWRVIRKIILLLVVLHLTFLILFRWFNPPITFTQLGSILEGNGLQRDYIAYDEMGDNIKLAVMAGEDQLFPDHNGFDIKRIKLAIKYNKKHPNKVRGASTISQQTAKNVFLWQKGGFFRKGIEVYYTFMIENLWTKKRILEAYLNVIEMGEGIYGVQAAAQAYFNKDAKELTRAEAAQIAACLPNPKKLKVKPLSRYVTTRGNFLQKQMINLQQDPDIQELLHQ
jgi:monofunctional biosynthetic peptidoglycan transglycosylase